MSRRPRTSSTSPAQRGGAGTAPDAGAPQLSHGKSVAFWVITLALPFLLIGLLEAGLRVFGYGPNLGLFTTTTVHGTTYYLLNHEVKARYFPDIRFTASTSREYFVMPKPPGTFRIFVLGGSTAVGFPYGANGSFASFLRQRLACLFPDRKIELINLGMTGTNSYTVLDLARDLPAYSPDLLLVYDGHNEFYGGLGVESRGILGGSHAATLVYLRLLHSKVFLLLRDMYGRAGEILHPGSTETTRDVSLEALARGKGVPYGSPAYHEALTGFEENLQDLRSFCAARHIPLILATQVSNLRGQPPFLSGPEAPLPAGEKRRFDDDRLQAEKAWNEHRWNDALRAYSASSLIDSLHAATHFAMGRCLDIMGERRSARTQYVLARDYDELRFRASSDFNNAILAQRAPGTAVVDMEGFFMQHSPDSLIGNELILEHLHPNSFGAFLLARGYASAMRELGLPAGEPVWAERDTIADSVLWSKRTVTALDERIALERTARLTSAYPFSSPSLSLPVKFPADTLQAMARHVVDGAWGVGDAHRAAGDFYEQRGETQEAEREFRTLIALDSLEPGSYVALARLYFGERRLADARDILNLSLRLNPSGEAYALLANVAFEEGDNAAAVAASTYAIPLVSGPDASAAAWYTLGLAQLRLHHRAEAEAALRSALAVSPQHEPSSVLLRALESGAPMK
ncbi:MAG TPA: hypothetical protein VL221_00535 [Bacteroidota bacterium]|nr:hypothetical protein [Bacteroidota bacterium]